MSLLDLQFRLYGVHDALHARPFVIASPVHAQQNLSAGHTQQSVISTFQEQIVNGMDWAFRAAACSVRNSVYTRVLMEARMFGKAMAM